MMYNRDLMEIAEWRLRELAKSAFQVPGDPSGGGAPPPGPPGGDPSGGGGMPPPGMDPSMGGAPPPDPSMGGGAAPGGGGLTADSISQIVMQTMQQQGMMGGGMGMGAGKSSKGDQQQSMAMDVFQIKKLLVGLYNAMGMPLPPDILDGPNRNPSTGLPMPPGAPGSTSDPATMAQSAPAQGGAGGAAPPGGGGAIPPIQPMQPGGPGVPPGAGGGGDPTKSSEDRTLHLGSRHTDGFDIGVISKAAALAAICRNIGRSK